MRRTYRRSQGKRLRPRALPDGAPFPARDLAIFLAGGVILVSLTAASASLPHLLKDLELPPEPSHQAEIDEARIAAAQAAIAAVERAQHELAKGKENADEYANVAVIVMDVYRARIADRQQRPEAVERAREFDQIERKLRVAGLAAERTSVRRCGSPNAYCRRPSASTTATWAACVVSIRPPR